MSSPSNLTTAPVRERVPLRDVRLASCAVKNGDNFRRSKKPFNKDSPFIPAVQADLEGRLGDRAWRLVYFNYFNVERPARAGWLCYTLELQSLTRPELLAQYVFDAPNNRVLQKSLTAKRVQDRRAKAVG